MRKKLVCHTSLDNAICVFIYMMIGETMKIEINIKIDLYKSLFEYVIAAEALSLEGKFRKLVKFYPIIKSNCLHSLK